MECAPVLGETLAAVFAQVRVDAITTLLCILFLFNASCSLVMMCFFVSYYRIYARTSGTCLSAAGGRSPPPKPAGDDR
jgi:hypothetical protein